MYNLYMINTNKKAYFLYTIISLILILISLILGLIFSVYEALIVISTTSFFGVVMLLINLSDQDKAYNEVNPNLQAYIFKSLGRFLSYGGGLVLSSYFIYLLDGNSNKIKYMYLLIGLIPIFVNIVVFYLRNKDV